MPELLRLAAVDAGYDGAPVVRELTSTSPPGRSSRCSGPNGAGKTTTLSTIAGLLPCIGGTVEVDGEDIAGLPDAQARAPRRLARARGPRRCSSA